MRAISEQIYDEGALLVDTVRLVRFYAFFWITSLLPSMHSDVNILINRGSNFEAVPCAGSSAEFPLSIWCRLIVKHQEVVSEPAGSVVADDCHETLTIVIRDGHEENTIVLGSLSRSRLFSELGGPALALVTVGASVAFLSPWVSQLDETRSV